MGFVVIRFDMVIRFGKNPLASFQSTEDSNISLLPLNIGENMGPKLHKKLCQEQF